MKKVLSIVVGGLGALALIGGLSMAPTQAAQPTTSVGVAKTLPSDATGAKSGGSMGTGLHVYWSCDKRTRVEQNGVNWVCTRQIVAVQDDGAGIRMSKMTHLAISTYSCGSIFGGCDPSNPNDRQSCGSQDDFQEPAVTSDFVGIWGYWNNGTVNRVFYRDPPSALNDANDCSIAWIFDPDLKVDAQTTETKWDFHARINNEPDFNGLIGFVFDTDVYPNHHNEWFCLSDGTEFCKRDP